MIYTLTLNPSLDYIMNPKSIEIGKTNRSEKELIVAGGKGINVSTLLRELGMESIALGFVAGFTGDMLVDILEKRNLNCDFISLKQGITRINVKIKGEKETEINAAGPEISGENLYALFSKLNILKDGDTLIIAGSVPPSLHDDIYEKIIMHLEGKKVKFIVDATKKVSLNTIKHHPFLIKPNKDELEEFFEEKMNNIDDIIKAAKKLQMMGATNVLVSMGANGALLLDEFNHIYTCEAPKGKLINSVGSGDSMVAGFVYGYSLNNDYKEALKYGNICGGANAFCQDLATKKEIDKVAKQTLTIKQIQ